MEGLDNVGFEGFSLFFVRVLFLICDEVPVCAMEGEHQAMKFAMSDNGGLEIGVSK